jgi:putative transposase
MPKPERVVVAGLPHHLTHRGNRREEIFRETEDFKTYLRLLHKAIERYAVRLWSYSLMPNHVHLVAVPQRPESLGRAMLWAQGQYAEFFNARYGLVGHLWQGRFRSSVMDEHHLLNGVRYVERNPVRAGLVQRAEDYPWSSAAAHCGLRQDPLISDDLPLLRDVPDWSSWLAGVESDEELRRIRECAERCYPIGSEAFVRRIEEQSGCRFPARNGNRKSKIGDEGAAPSSPMLNLKFSER